MMGSRARRASSAVGCRSNRGLRADGARRVLRLARLVLLAGLVPAVACEPPSSEAAGGEDVTAVADSAGQDTGDAYLRPTADAPGLTSGDTIPDHPSWTRQDWEVLEETVRWARREAVDTLPMGERVAALGRRFVGAPYVPRTLDPPGPERLVVNLRAFDCVTFVETVLTLAHVLGEAPTPVEAEPGVAMDLYEDILASFRYRGGTLDGYASRLHYFTEWIWDNANRQHIEIVTPDLGGVAVREPIDFMTSHRSSYPQLADDGVFERIRVIEKRLSRQTRYRIPEEEIAAVAGDLRTGDVIAATSTLEGLDVAHTGIAVRVDGALRLMHAPLVGDSVQVSERTLAERLLDIDSQDGIMVARPRDTGAVRILSGGER